jgi:hypothetical protein
MESNAAISEEITNMEVHKSNKGKKKNLESIIQLLMSKVQDLAGQIWNTLPTDNIPASRSTQQCLLSIK